MPRACRKHRLGSCAIPCLAVTCLYSYTGTTGRFSLRRTVQTAATAGAGQKQADVAPKGFLQQLTADTGVVVIFDLAIRMSGEEFSRS